jgi:16S rRNA (cytosine1402-N4)-methyltransferase
MHRPVLLKSAIDGLNIRPGGKYIDATFGEGGHAKEIIKRGGKVLGIDIDQCQMSNVKCQNKIIKNNSLRLVNGNFKYIEKIAKTNDFFPIDGVLFDLGLSMSQIMESERGFSYQRPNELLDMRLDIGQELTAEKIINNFSLNELYEILATFSEELNSRSIARAIIGARQLKKIERVGDLLTIIDRAVGKKDRKVYARVFQGLRIAVNSELENLKKGLAGTLKILKKEGRIVVISFHSLEDRLVKQFIRQNHLKEIDKNFSGRQRLSFERSAKLRVIGY